MTNTHNETNTTTQTLTQTQNQTHSKTTTNTNTNTNNTDNDKTVHTCKTTLIGGEPHNGSSNTRTYTTTNQKDCVSASDNAIAIGPCMAITTSTTNSASDCNDGTH